MTDLLPCPFCNGTPELIEVGNGAKYVWQARCTWCHVKTMKYPDKVTPRLVWNRRVPVARSPQENASE